MADITSTADDTDKDIVDDKGVPRKKPIADAEEAHRVAKRYFDNRKKANDNHGIVRLKYDGEPPYKVGSFAANGQSWRANTSRKSMSTAVQRCTPALIQFLDGLRYLTASRLPDSTAPTPPEPTPDASGAFAAPNPVPVPSPQEKSERFQRGITSLLRGWNGWRPFMYQIGDEDILFGHITAACLDDVEWRPQAFSFDQFAGNSESSHDINEWDAIVFKKNFAIHELVSFIEDAAAAKDAGWDVDNVVDAINHSQPEDKRRTDTDRVRLYADMIRDGNMAQSCKENARAVETYVVYYREYSGKVSQYIVLQSQPNAEGDHAKEEKSALFYSEDRFESMAHIASLFSIQHGNGKFYGSIGLGRELFGMSISMDKAFCRMLDLAYLMSLMPLPDDKSTSPNRAPFSFDGVFMRVAASQDNLKNKPFEGNVSALMEVMQTIQNVIEQLSNSYLPRNTADPGKATATEIIDDARKIDMVTGDRLARFYGQFCRMIEMIQRRVCSQDNIKAAVAFVKKEQAGKILLPDDEYDFYEAMRDKQEVSESQYVKYELPSHLDKDAIMLCVEFLREGLEPLDIYRLSRSSANEPMGDTPDAMRQKLLQAYPMFQANPAIDQYGFGKEVFAAATSPQFADEYYLPPNANQTAELEQAQKQLLELGAMTSIGAPIPVLPSDDDAAHRNVLKPALATIPNDPQQVAANPIKHQALTLISKHFDAHLAAGKQKGEKGEAFAQDADISSHYGALLNKADQIVANQQQQPPQSTPALPAPQPQ